jgi:probable HAF family extracellular repeat protein
MKFRNFILAITVTVVTAMIIPSGLVAQEDQGHHKQVRYTVTDLGTLGGTFSWAYGINSRGSVVGYATLTGDTSMHAFFWREGVMRDLGTLASSDTAPVSAAYSINDDDEAVGVSETSSPDPNGLDSCGFGNFLVCLPVVWRNGAITALPTLGGPDGQASAINNHGQIVGIAQSDEIDPLCQNPVLKPMVWEHGQARPLPTVPFLDGIVGGAPGPAGNNHHGQVVGIITKCDGSFSRAVLWEKHKVIDMGSIAGAVPVPVTLNDKGQAVGTYTIAGINRAFLWHDGVATDLGTLPGDVFAEGNGINNEGQVVGQSCGPNGCNGFLWWNDLMTDLNALTADPSLRAVDPIAINSRGQIVGVALQTSTGEAHAFLAIPCDDDHPNVDGCDYSMVDAAEVANNAAVPHYPQAIPQTMDSLARTTNPWQNWFRQRYRVLGQRPALRH